MKASNLTPRQFKEWRISQGMTHKACAECLGMSISNVFLYEAGQRPEGEVKIPILAAWAMAAITHKLKPYGEENDNSQSQ